MTTRCFLCKSTVDASGNCTNSKCPRYKKTRIELTVTNASGTALEGATVSYSGGSGTTNSSGQVIFSGLTAGTYDFTVEMSGYTGSTTSETITANAATTATIALTATA
jgi:hypothetical protein